VPDRAPDEAEGDGVVAVLRQHIEVMQQIADGFAGIVAEFQQYRVDLTLADMRACRGQGAGWFWVLCHDTPHMFTLCSGFAPKSTAFSDKSQAPAAAPL